MPWSIPNDPTNTDPRMRVFQTDVDGITDALTGVGWESGCDASAAASWTRTFTAGVYRVGGVAVTVPGVTTSATADGGATITSDATNPRWLTYEVDAAGVVHGVLGAAAARPQMPARTAGRGLLRAYLIAAAAASLSEAGADARDMRFPVAAAAAIDAETAARIAADALKADLSAFLSAFSDLEAFAASNVPDHTAQSHLGPEKHQYSTGLTVDEGVSTGGGANTLGDTSKAWAVNSLAGAWVRLASPTRSDEVQIISNTATQITTWFNFPGGAPPVGTRYFIVGGGPLLVLTDESIGQNLVGGGGNMPLVYENKIDKVAHVAQMAAVAPSVEWNGNTVMSDMSLALLPSLASLSAWIEVPDSRQPVDLTWATSCRLRASVRQTQAAGLMRVAYSADSGATWATISASGTDIVVSLATVDEQAKSSRLAIAAAAKAEVLVRLESWCTASTPQPVMGMARAGFR